MELQKFYQVIETASLEDLEVISSAVQDRRDQLSQELGVQGEEDAQG